MGIRRRRRKLTTLVGTLDQRVRAVELRAINLLTSDQIAAATGTGEEAPADAPPTNIISGSAPARWVRVEDAYLYPKKLTGLDEDRVNIYTQVDLGLSKNQTIQVSGVRWIGDVNVDAEGSFTIKHTDVPPWDNRASWKHDPTQDQLSGVTITNEYSYKPDTAAPSSWSTRQRYTTRSQVSTYAITQAGVGSPSQVTLTTSSAHKFVAGDIIYIDLRDSNAAAYGIDGLFEIDSVTDTTIVYTLELGVDAAVTATAPSVTTYVFPCVRYYLAVGSTWSDSSTNKIYVWDGIRWVDYSAADITEDGDPPSPPTSLSATSVGTTRPGSQLPYAKVTLSWTPPTTSASGDPINDLLGYQILWRSSELETYRTKDVVNPDATSYTFDEDATFLQGETYYFQVKAFDSGWLMSEPAELAYTTEVKESTISDYAPVGPSVSSRLGTIQVTWNGYLQETSTTQIPAPADVSVLEVHMSTVSATFTPSESTLIDTLIAYPNNFTVVSDLAYNTTYYFRLVLKDTSGNVSPPSLAGSGQVQPLVDTDLIANTLSTWPFAGQTVPPGALANGSINASTLFGPNVVVQNAIAANAIGVNELAAGAVVAGKIGANAITTNTIAALQIDAGKIKANAIEADKINAGAITTVKLDANAVTAAKISANAVTAGKILVTDTFQYQYSGNANQKVRIGASSIPTLSTITTPGIAATKDSTNYVWLAAIGDQVGQVGSDYNNQNIEFFYDDTIFYSAASHAMFTGFGTVNFTNDPQSTSGQAYWDLDNSSLRVDYTTDGNSDRYALRVRSLSGFMSFWVDTSSKKEVHVNGASSTANALIVNGDVNATAFNTTSSRRYKEEITVADVSDAILDVPAVTFKYNQALLPREEHRSEGLSDLEFGLIAEDVSEAGMDFLVQYDDEGLPAGIEYPKVGVALIPVIKRLKEKVESLEARIVELENK